MAVYVLQQCLGRLGPERCQVRREVSQSRTCSDRGESEYAEQAATPFQSGSVIDRPFQTRRTSRNEDASPNGLHWARVQWLNVAAA